MKSIFTHISLVLLLCFAQMYNSFVALNYQVNYKYYTEVLCENIDKPELHCDGKCFLAKVMNLDKGSHNSLEPPVLIPTFGLFKNQNQAVDLTRVDIQSASDFLSSNFDLPKSPYLPSCEHPPKV